jgi:hypothetical protein
LLRLAGGGRSCPTLCSGFLGDSVSILRKAGRQWRQRMVKVKVPLRSHNEPDDRLNDRTRWATVCCCAKGITKNEACCRSLSTVHHLKLHMHSSACSMLLGKACYCTAGLTASSPCCPCPSAC